jgi:hypothetical protein
MTWFKAHWKAIAGSVVVFLVGVGIGTGGSSAKTTAVPSTLTVNHTVITPSSSAATETVMDTITVTRTAKPKPKPKPKPAKAVTFSGNGGETLPAFTVSHDSTLRWTNDGDIFQIFDLSSDYPGINVNSQAHSGSTAVSAGRYSKITVNAIGNWTIRIG